MGAALAVPTFVYGFDGGVMRWLSLAVIALWCGALLRSEPAFRIIRPVTWAVLLALLTANAYSAGIGSGSAALHILLWISATAAVFLTSVQSLLLLYGHYRIKRSPDRGHFVPMDQMNRTLSLLAAGGLILVTAALGYSWWWSLASGTALNWSQQKQVLAVVVWALLAVVLIARWLLGFRGHRIAGWIFAVMGAVMLLLAWFSSLQLSH